MRRQRWVTAGMVGAVAALTILTAGPAGATTPASLTAATPTWSPSTSLSAAVMKANGSFTNKASSTATYSYTLQLLSTTSSTKPSCATSGCVTTTNRSLVVLTVVSGSVSLKAYATGSVPTLSWNCASSSTTRYYWSWLKVNSLVSTDVVATPVVSAGGLKGTYC